MLISGFPQSGFISMPIDMNKQPYYYYSVTVPMKRSGLLSSPLDKPPSASRRLPGSTQHETRQDRDPMMSINKNPSKQFLSLRTVRADRCSIHPPYIRDYTPSGVAVSHLSGEHPLRQDVSVSGVSQAAAAVPDVGATAKS